MLTPRGRGAAKVIAASVAEAEAAMAAQFGLEGLGPLREILAALAGVPSPISR